MMRNLLLTTVLLFSSMTLLAQALTANQILTRIHNEYAERFSNGKYIDDPNLTAKFRSSQLNAIQILRQNKMIGHSFQIRNSAMPDLIITASIVQEQNFDFAGLLIERNKYASADSESLLRLFDFPILNHGMSLYMMNDHSVIDVKLQSLTAQNTGVIALKYPIDFNNNQFDIAALNIVRTANGFIFKSPTGTDFSTMKLDVWYSIFSQNFGVKSVTFQ